jgi:tetratricopeptide (TPR) repeat protein
MDTPSGEADTLVSDDAERFEAEGDEPELEDSFIRAVAAAPAVGRESRLAVGTVIDGTYRIEGVLGAGAMGVVYEAADLMLDRRVALKLHDVGPGPERSSRMWREAKAMARLSDPNVITVHEVGWHEGSIFIAMELVEGGNARAWCKERPRAWREIVDVYVQAARGLAAAHRVGIVHRDFKPDNVLVGRDGRVRVADFGLARAAGDLGSSGSQPPSGHGGSPSVDSNLTRTGMALGTPAYMAPEQIDGKPVDARADQFAFCIALHEALWGLRPFAGATLGELSQTIAAGELVPLPAAPRVPRRLHDVLRRGLAADPARRWPDMHALVTALLRDPGVGRRRRIAAMVGIAVVAGTAWAAGARGREAPCTDVGAAIDGTWNDTRRAEIAEAFARTGSGLADTALAGVESRVDAWTTAWKDERQHACEATRVLGEQSEARMDQRMDCLDRARVQLAAMLEQLGTADIDVLVHVPGMLQALPDLEACADPDALDAVAPIPAARRPIHDALHARVATAHAAYRAGRAQVATASVDELLPELEAEGFGALAAHARHVRGAVRVDHGEHEAGAADFREVVAYALRTGDDRWLTTGMMDLGRALGRMGPGAVDEGLRWIDAADAAHVRASTDISTTSDIESARVEVALFGDRHAEAERAARAALERIPDDDYERGYILSMLASAVEFQGRSDEAIAIHREAIAFLEAQGGPDDAAVSGALGNLSISLLQTGRVEEAMPVIRRALAIREAVYGADSPVTAEMHRNLGIAHRMMGDLAAAEAELQRAVEICRARKDDPGTMLAIANLANIAHDLGDIPRARDLAAEALAIAERTHGPQSLRAGQFSASVASYSATLGQRDDAIVHGQRALSLLEQHLGPDHPDVAVACANLAQIVAKEGRVDEGVALVERARKIATASVPAEAPQQAGFMIAHADVLSLAERLDEAIALRREAIAHYESTTYKDRPDIVEARLGLGTDLLRHGDAAAARPVLEDALAGTDTIDVPPAMVASVRWALARALWPETAQRARARDLATMARDELSARGDTVAAEIEAWLAEHPAR